MNGPGCARTDLGADRSHSFCGPSLTRAIIHAGRALVAPDNKWSRSAAVTPTVVRLNEISSLLVENTVFEILKNIEWREKKYNSMCFFKLRAILLRRVAYENKVQVVNVMPKN
ncbi:hypothetical protein EVAR_15872_1 [Eumeta japonica]|uniref:Uncharacterized protein n=1 Tax=Eumeta variegata TaxID=151549 RepID=A0A4C1UFE0_EUMVA|nr:hypothetical protein EVAR_15872_1 [Eumeta japonica]